MQVNARLDDAAPVRRIGRGHRGVRGRMMVHGTPVRFESSLEADFLEIISFDRSVTKLCEQPVQLRLHDRYGAGHRYTPDFLVVHRGLDVANRLPRGFLYEVKYRADLFATWPNLKPKFLEARRYARERGLEFRIVTEVEVRGPHLDNVRYLNHHRHAARDAGCEERLTEVLLAADGPMRVSTLLSRAWNDTELRRAGETSLLRMMALGDVHTDLAVPIKRDSVVWAQAGIDGGCLWDPYSSRSTKD